MVIEPIYIFLLVAGASVGFLSGLLGIGGGIVMFPLLLYGPPALGLVPIEVKDITGLTMVQGFFASFTAMLFYKKHQLLNRELVFTLGLALFLSSLVGALFSSRVDDSIILITFGMLAVIAAVMMLIPRSYSRDEYKETHVKFSSPLAIFIGLTLGFLLGMLGQGGAFIVIPIMLYVLKIPLRVAVGSMLGIGLFSAIAGTAGKVLTGQVPFLFALVMLVGAMPAARLGARVGKNAHVKFLRWLLAAIIMASAVKIWIDIL